MNISNWVKATDRFSGQPIWLNLEQPFAMKVVLPSKGGEQAFTRIWGCAMATTSDAKGEPTATPLTIDIQETPEQLFMAAWGSLPGVTQ